MSIVYRETQAPVYVSGNDFCTLGNYAHSFNTMPKISQLREVIAPGTVRRFNNAFQTGNLVPLQSQLAQTEQPLTQGSAVVYDMGTIPRSNPPPFYNTQTPPPAGTDYTIEDNYVSIWKP